MRKVYLDNNATTKMREEVLEAMLPYYREEYGNASSVHQFGRTARKAIDEARAKVAALLGAASAEEVIRAASGIKFRLGAPSSPIRAATPGQRSFIDDWIDHHSDDGPYVKSRWYGQE